MLLLILLILVGVLLFGGLGVFVAKVFLIGLVAVLLIGLLGGGSLMRRR